LKIKDLRPVKINTKLIQKLFLSALFHLFLQKISSYNLNYLRLPKSSQNVEISTKKPLTIAVKGPAGAGVQIAFSVPQYFQRVRPLILRFLQKSTSNPPVATVRLQSDCRYQGKMK
jgi:hypothetical protein